MQRPIVLAIGNPRRVEFRASLASVHDQSDLVVVRNPGEALDQLSAGRIPELILLWQSRPGQHSALSIDNLRRAAPAARWLVIAGSWCEGELRTGRPPEGATRWYWHQHRSRLLGAPPGNPPWTHPATFTDEERLLATHAPDAQTLRAARIGILARDEAMRDILTKTFARAGATIHAWRAPREAAENVDVALCDARTPTDTDELATLRHHVPQAAIFALVGFPRWQDILALRQAGASAIVSKPFVLNELVWLVQQVGQRSRQPLPRPRTRPARPHHSNAARSG